MSKTKRIVKKFLIGFISILILLFILLIISVPYGRSTEKRILNPGISYTKIVLKEGNVLTMLNDSILKNKNIYLENGEVTAIDPAIDKIVEGFTVINAKGKFIMPSLIDMHAHIFDRNDLPQYLSYGVTTVRNMMGFPMHLRWKQQLKNNEIPGSNLITATPTINSGNNAGPFHKVVNNITETEEAIITYVNAGYDFIKIYDDVNSEQLKTIQNVARSNGLLIAGHPPKVSFEALLSSSLISIEHVEELRKFLDKENSSKSIKDIAKQIKKSNKAITINLIAFYRIYKTAIEGQSYLDQLNDNPINPVISFIGDQQLGDYTEAGSKYKVFAKEKFNTLQKLARALSDEGVEILLGTDAGPNFITPGKAVFEEIELLTQSGISPFNILKSTTISAANVLQKKNLGVVQVGLDANLLVLDANPLEKLSTLKNPEIIFKGSHYYTSREIKKLRKIGEKKQSTYATIGLFLEHLINK